MKTPLAWRNLTSSKQRLLLSTLGIVFAVLLMFMQIGFRTALLESAVELIQHLDGDLYLISATRYRLMTNDAFPLRRVHQVRGVAGVQSSTPLYIELEQAVWKHPQDRSSHTIRVLGIDPDAGTFRLSAIRDQQRRLRVADTALFDRRSRPFLGTAAPGTRTELSGRGVNIIGEFEIGADFAIDGNLVVGNETFRRMFQQPGLAPRLSQVEIGVIRLADGANLLNVQRQVRSALENDVVVLTRQELLDFERSYWKKTSPVGFVFGLGTFVGFIVGTMICYQILFSDLSDQLPQFATLKAIGYDNRYLKRVVRSQAILLAFFGFVPATAISFGLYQFVSSFTGLQMRLEPPLVAVMLLVTILMCWVSGALAVRKVLGTDPAEVF